MQISSFPFQTLNWSTVPKTIHNGITGKEYWQIFMMGEIRVRLVEYSADYLADHWCNKGHIIFCIEGSMLTELNDGQKLLLEKGMSYHVGDNCEAHRSSSILGCKLFIVD